ncbi:MAG: hypothetical protein HY784_12600, partial [Chloroflexi bacterium]|nr:hypothetical protein [Chloroflexota bacterium]
MDYAELLSRGIQAARAGKPEEARRHFGFAVRARPADPRPWLWLCAVLDDPAQQRDCLQRALHADPDSRPARLLLARLENLTPDELGLPEPPPLSARAFDCPRCGGQMRYNPDEAGLLCQHCGHSEGLAHPDASGAEHDLTAALESPGARNWALAGGELICQNCGARTSIAPEQRSLPCPFCGSPTVLEQGAA